MGLTVDPQDVPRELSRIVSSRFRKARCLRAPILSTLYNVLCLKIKPECKILLIVICSINRKSLHKVQRFGHHADCLYIVCMYESCFFLA